MIYLFFATGTEEVEALATVDILRRAGLPLQIVSVTGEQVVTGAHQIRVVTDALIEDIDVDCADMLILPGGMPGATNFAAHPLLNTYLVQHVAADRPVAAICAAPLVLGRRSPGTCYPC